MEKLMSGGLVWWSGLPSRKLSPIPASMDRYAHLLTSQPGKTLWQNIGYVRVWGCLRLERGVLRLERGCYYGAKYGHNGSLCSSAHQPTRQKSLTKEGVRVRDWGCLRDRGVLTLERGAGNVCWCLLHFNLFTSWCHLYWLQIWPLFGVREGVRKKTYFLWHLCLIGWYWCVRGGVESCRSDQTNLNWICSGSGMIWWHDDNEMIWWWQYDHALK